jgi:hypothetical protein
VRYLIASVAVLIAALFSIFAPRDSAVATGVAPGGCGTTVNHAYAAKGFIGVRAIAKFGVTIHQVIKSVPKNTVALWCASQAFISSEALVILDIRFQSNASAADEGRASTYFWNTGLFRDVLVMDKLCWVTGTYVCPPVEGPTA